MDAERRAAAEDDAGAAAPAEADEADERTVTFVEEADELLRLARGIGASGGAADDAAYARVASIVRPLARPRRARRRAARVARAPARAATAAGGCATLRRGGEGSRWCSPARRMRLRCAVD
jgi:hypothetical protein